MSQWSLRALGTLAPMLVRIRRGVQGAVARWVTWRSVLRVLPIGLLVSLAFLVTVFRLRNGEFPSFDEATRYRQLAQGYLGTRGKVVIRQGRLRPPGPSSVVLFPQDEYLRGVFGGSVLEAVRQRNDSQVDNRLIILEQANYGVLNPLLGFFFPFRKHFEVSFPLTDVSPRIYDAQLLDLDGDGTDEVLVTWLEYYGGSGGNLAAGIVASVDGDYQFIDFVPSHRVITLDLLQRHRQELLETERLVARLKRALVTDSLRQRATERTGIDPQEVLVSLQEGLPTRRGQLATDSGTFAGARADNPLLEILLVPETLSTTVVQNGHQERRILPWLHTDVFFKFENVDRDAGLELIAAYPAGDGECHWCPQSWAVVTYEIQGKKWAPDRDFEMIWIPRKRGWGLAAVHGYRFAPTFGEIYPFWTPSWLALPSGEDAEVKARARSVIVDTVLQTHRNR